MHNICFALRALNFTDVTSPTSFDQLSPAGGTVDWGNGIVWSLPQFHNFYAFVAKINGSGQTQWASYFAPSGTFTSQGYGVSFDTANNVYLVCVGSIHFIHFVCRKRKENRLTYTTPDPPPIHLLPLPSCVLPIYPAVNLKVCE